MNRYTDEIKRNMLRWRFISLGLLIVLVATLAAPMRSSAQTSVFYGHWPYAFKTPINLNSFANDGYPNVLGFYADLIELPSAYYLWASGEYEGIAAKATGFGADALFSITINPNAKWSDGTLMTSRDLVATYAILRLRNAPEYRYIEAVTAKDDHTVEFKLKFPSAIAERLILKTRIRPAATYGAIADQVTALLAEGDNLTLANTNKLQATDAWKALVKQLTDLRPTQIIASGPYTLDAADITATQVTLRKNPNSMFADKATFDTIVLFQGNGEKLLAKLQVGELTYSHDTFLPEQEASFEQAGYTILRTPTYAGPALFFNHDRYTLGKLEVRQAIAYVLDRTKIAKTAFGESAAPIAHPTGVSDLLLPLWAQFAGDDTTLDALKDYAVDVNNATELLTGIGFTQKNGQWIDDQGEPFTLHLGFPGEVPRYLNAAQEIAAELSAFGIKTLAEGVSSTDLLKATSAGRFDLTLWTWGVIGNPFPYNSLRNQFYSLNAPGLNNQPGMDFPLEQTVNGETVDIGALIASLDSDIEQSAQGDVVMKLSQMYNDLLPILPIAERYTNAPLLTTQLTGVPSADNDIFLNAYSADNYVILWLMQGVIKPA
jgi:peptide/nickel transport system substrate-binding protein